MNSENRSLKDLQDKIIQFRNDRNWEQFHGIKDLLQGLTIEVAELSELFLWKDEDEIQKVESEKIGDEIADVYIFLNYISARFKIDLEKAVLNKIEKNEKKYPVGKSFGSNKKYNEL